MQLLHALPAYIMQLLDSSHFLTWNSVATFFVMLSTAAT